MTKMAKIFAALLLGLLNGSALAASPVWRVQSGHHQLFLVGTIHVLRKSDYPLPKALDQAWQQADRMVFETDIGKTQTAAFAQQLMQTLRLPAGRRLEQTLSPQTITLLQGYARQHNINLDTLQQFKPSMIAMTLTLGELQRLGIGEQGVDEYYFMRAQKDHKPVQGLETPQQQLDFLANMGKGVEDDMILQTLAEMNDLATQFPLMIKSWKHGDSQQMVKLFILPMRDQFNPVYQQLLVERNRAWLPQIKHFLATPETEMVLVGSAHLIGPDGLLKQLKKAGFNITQMD